MTEMLNRRIVSTTEVNISAALAAANGEGGRVDAGEPTFKMTPEEALFFECVVEALDKHGIEAPPMLQLSPSNTKVVDYEFVKKYFARRMLNCEGDGPEARELHRQLVKASLKRSRTALTAAHIVGVDAPWVWWTGKTAACGAWRRAQA